MSCRLSLCRMAVFIVVVVYLHLESDLDGCVRISFERELNSLIRVHLPNFPSNYMLYRGGIEDDAKGL
jgi:hypothetical protein